MATLEELDRRVSALEAAQNDTTQTLRWVVVKLGRMSAVQEEHTLRLDRIETRLEGVEQGLSDVRDDMRALRTEFGGLRTEFGGLKEALPGIVRDVMREVLRERGRA